MLNEGESSGSGPDTPKVLRRVSYRARLALAARWRTPRGRFVPVLLLAASLLANAGFAMAAWALWPPRDGASTPNGTLATLRQEPNSPDAYAPVHREPPLPEPRPPAPDQSLPQGDSGPPLLGDALLDLLSAAPSSPRAAPQDRPAPPPRLAGPASLSLSLPTDRVRSGLLNPQSSARRVERAQPSEGGALRPAPAAQPAPAAPPSPPKQRAPALTAAKPLVGQSPKPNYSRRDRRRGLVGTVVLEASIDERGLPYGIRIISSSGSERLDRSARLAFERWRFEPARRGQRPVPGRHRQSFEFRPR